MKKTYKALSCVLASSIMLSNTIPVMATEDNNVSEKSTVQTASIQVEDNGIIINGVYYTPKEFEDLLDLAESIELPKPRRQKRALPVAGVAVGAYFVPGVGQVLITATGAVIVGGVAIAAGSWAYKKIVSYFKSHTKNKRKSTYDKHTKPRPGRKGMETKKVV